MPLRDLLKKKDKENVNDNARYNGTFSSTAPPPPEPETAPPTYEAPEFVFMRSDTNTQELISPPSFPNAEANAPVGDAESGQEQHHKRRSFFRRKSSTGSTATTSTVSTSGGLHGETTSTNKSDGRRLSGRLQLRPRSRNASTSSIHVPADLPNIDDDDNAIGTADADQSKEKAENREAQWERRATLLAGGTRPSIGGVGGAPSSTSSRPTTPLSYDEIKRDAAAGGLSWGVSPDGVSKGRPRKGSVSDPQGDETIQEAIRLHEAGELEQSTAMFGRLADPEGQNNALSQVLYGLALRHGWGCSPDPEKGIHYLTLAAQNSAAVESLALESGMKKGGAAKGELVLAIYELANCFRHGWGVPKKDLVAAKQYYETAANLGDVDAMNEVARCYETGAGTPKDKAKAAKYYRLAEQNGNKTVGNSWIWKEKYNPK